MDIKNMQYMMQLQAMSSMQGGQRDTFATGLMDMAFQSVLEAAMSQTGQDKSSTLPLNTMNAFQSQPLNIQYINDIKPVAVKASPEELNPIIKKAAEQFGVDEELIRSVIHAESNFDSTVVSHAGAQGLMQLMPGTARGLGVTDAFDPEQNIMGGTKYLKQMLDRYQGDTRLALAAYNAGPGNVDKYAGIPPFEETQNYVKKILG
ncbi:lytic transglycosylase domain-containing protein [Thalassobacillus hwangdonensis]|uniref:Lytic transglycosylase domain-containing protein n=1 Tax=Thalassobacillus hwangdonensis TaxID=546108 RepID=A0ABW3L014_9BACI